MTQNASFFRKIVYGSAIVVLLLPLFWLGQPATSATVGAEGSGSAGGVLARMRAKHGLSQAELGQIDPASETMKMATLGLRGVATNLLWTKANEYKRTESWDRLSATLNQIAKLQPNYISVWEFQAHNLSYNISAEFDDYRMRYHWVKKGIEFLIDGTRYNLRNPRLFWNLGWFTGAKIGRPDERVQFRRMFPTDHEFHDTMADFININEARGPDGYPDNWLVAFLWYLQSQAVVEKGVPVTWMRIDPDSPGYTDNRRSPLIFYADPSMSLIRHAEAITGEITPGERTREAWRRAGLEWDRYGAMDIPSSWGHTIRLNMLSEYHAEANRWRKRLESLAPQLREEMLEERRATLTPQEREIYELTKHPSEWTEEDSLVYMRAHMKMSISDLELADAMPDEVQVQARYFARRATEASHRAERIASSANIVNFQYWKKRCEVEQSRVTADARRYMLFGDQAAERGDPEGAREEYEKAWSQWAQIFDAHPELIHDAMADDLEDAIGRYQLVLDQLDEEFPDDFPLKRLRERDSVEDTFLDGFPPGDPTSQRGETGDPNASQESNEEPAEEPERPKEKEEEDSADAPPDDSATEPDAPL